VIEAGPGVRGTRSSVNASVTIGLPVFNGERTLARALDSLLAQDCDHLNLIVCDNASTDGTVEIATDYAGRDPRVRVVRNPSNVGLVGNFNRVFALSNTTYFKWATHDDVVDHEYLSVCMDAFDAHPSAVLSSTAVVVHDVEGRELTRWSADPGLGSPDPARRTAALVRTLGETYPLFGLIKTDALRKVGPLGTYLVADRVLLSRLSILGPFLMSDRHLYHYTHHRPAGRTYSLYNDPASAGSRQMRTWRAIGEHLKATWGSSELATTDKLVVSRAVMERFAVRDARRLTAEVYHAGRSALRPASSPVHGRS
jgi:glycosyltransferase involved in cell wall biosynthesis